MSTMKVIFLDGETTVQLINGEIDGSPFNPDNKLVSMHWFLADVDPEDPESIRAVQKWIADHKDSLVHTSVFYHKEVSVADRKDQLQADLSKADLGVAHNAKFDIEWLNETGFDIPEQWWCTMIGEYIFARGQGAELSLKASADRRGVTAKKTDLIDKLFNKGKGLGFEEMPLDTVIEYAEADVVSCAELCLDQMLRLHEEENQSLWNIFTLMNEMMMFLVDVESNGIAIDMDALLEVEKDYLEEQAQLQTDLRDIVEEVMGDTPINLNSGVDMTQVIYSRKMVDRKLHAEVFNIGTDAKGKKKYPPRMKKAEFAGAVRATTKVVYRTVAVCCPVCKGSGKVWKQKKNGERYKNPNKCGECGGDGAIYQPTGKVAGLKLSPIGPQQATANGFAAGKDEIAILLAQAEDKGNLQAKEFLTKMMRLNAISAYLSNFINGIKYWTRPDGILHPNFNQTIAATGRLSSSKPNFQNLPKGAKFPVRKAVVSRFTEAYFKAHGIDVVFDEDGNPIWGEILEADFSGLEFRAAGELSRDEQIIKDILDGKDIHKQTASIINECVQEAVSKEIRQAAKPYTFAPLYGGMGASEPAHIQKYFQEFFVIYQGLAAYQKVLCDTAIKTGIIQTPSGRQYKFDKVRRFRGGRVSQQTKIVNFPIQGYATGDLVPLACIRARREFKRLGLRSLLIITVHDSIVVDIFPGEREQVIEALAFAMRRMPDEAHRRWGHKFILPLDIEAESGPNWMTMTERKLPAEDREEAPVRDQFEDEFTF